MLDSFSITAAVAIHCGNPSELGTNKRMQSYFQKVKGSALSMAKQGMQLLSTVKTEVLSKDAATTSGNTVKSNETSSSAEALAQTYVQLTATLDGLILDSPIESESQKSAKVSGGSSFYHEEKLLLQSPAKGLLLKLIQLLQQESQSWQRSHISDIDLLDMDSIAMPCIGFFLQHKIVSKLCDRAILDRPQGVLVLVVSWLAKLLESVKYPLLPIVHKPVARLVAMVVRYDAMHGIDLYADPRGAAQASNSSGCVVHEQHGYQRRLGN